MESLLLQDGTRAAGSEREPLAELDQEHVVGGDVEGLAEAAPKRDPVARAQRLVAPRLRPHEVDERARAGTPSARPASS